MAWNYDIVDPLTLTGNEYVLIEQGGVTKRITVSDLGAATAGPSPFAFGFTATPSSGLTAGDPITLTGSPSLGYPGYVVRFYSGDPDAGGVKIGGDHAVVSGDVATATVSAQAATTYQFYATGTDAQGTRIKVGPISRTVA